MKRLVSFTPIENGKLKVTSISAPVDPTQVDISGNLDSVAFIDADYQDPIHNKGMKTTLYYNPELGVIEVEYSELTFDDLSSMDKISYLKKTLDSNSLSQEEKIELTQLAVFELAEMLLGGAE